MSNKLIIGLCLLGLTACKDQADTVKPNSSTTQPDKKEAFQMYEMSEMAAYMEKLYQQNEALKAAILKDSVPKVLPYETDPFFEAEFTDPSANDTQFKSFAMLYENQSKLIVSDPQNAKQHYNNSIHTCISCHEQKCTGPLTRIKRLLIKD